MKKIINQYNIVTLLRSQSGHMGDAESLRQQQCKQFLNAAYDGDLEQVQKLYKAGIPINISWADSGASALILAVLQGHFPIVKFLVEHDININATTKLKTTALMVAAARGRAQIVEYLIEKGADISLANATHANALSYALETFEGTEEEILPVIKILLRHRIDIELVETEANFTPLMIASQHGYFEIVKLLVEAGADVNASSGMIYQDLSDASPQEQISYLKQANTVEATVLIDKIRKTGKSIKYAAVFPAESPLSLAPTDEIRDYLVQHGAKE